MEPNVCGRHRLHRSILSLALLVIGFRTRDRTLGTLTFVAGSDRLATTLIQRCPVNALVGYDTCEGC